MANHTGLEAVLPHRKITEIDWAWLGGLFDGEGCVGWYIARHRRYTKGGRTRDAGEYWATDNQIRLHLMNTSYELLEEVVAITGVGKIYRFDGKSTFESRKPIRQWETGRMHDAHVIIPKILPYIHEHEKHKKMVKILSWLDENCTCKIPLGERGSLTRKKAYAAFKQRKQAREIQSINPKVFPLLVVSQ